MTSISTTVNDDPLAFTDIHSWSAEGLGGWTDYVLDLTDYVGQEVYIAFHHNRTGHSAICIDNIYFEGACLGIVEEAESIGVYPNPSNDKVSIDGIEIAEIEVYNTLGQLVKTVEDTNEISVAGLPEGVYVLRIRDAEGKNHVERVAVKK